MCKISETRVKHERHECDTSVTRTTQVQHKWGKSKTIAIRVRHKWKILNLRMARVKTCFHTSILTICQMKNCRERSNFILRMPFVNDSFSCQNALEKSTTKAELCNGKSFVKKLYTRWKIDCPISWKLQTSRSWPRPCLTCYNLMKDTQKTCLFSRAVTFWPTFDIQISLTFAIVWEKLQNYTFGKVYRNFSKHVTTHINRASHYKIISL